MTSDSLRSETHGVVADIEEGASCGQHPRPHRGYRIRVNDEHFIVHQAVIRGRDVLELARLLPVERYCLLLRVRGQRPQVIPLETAVDLTAPGVERFEAEEKRPVSIKVNEHELEVLGPKASGLEIKQAAAKAGIEIELDFVLSEELPNGRTRIIGDCDRVTLREGACFVAVAPDDNS